MSNELNTFQEGQTYTVILGESFQNPEQEIYKTVSYDFQPKKLDRSKQALLTETGNGKVQAYLANSNNVDEDLVYSGNAHPQKETECVLIFEGSQFRLERVTSSTTLKHFESKSELANNRTAAISVIMNNTNSKIPPLINSTPMNISNDSKKRKRELISHTERIIPEKSINPVPKVAVQNIIEEEEELPSSDEEVIEEENDENAESLESFGTEVQNELLMQQQKMEEELEAARKLEAAIKKTIGQTVENADAMSDGETEDSSSESSSGDSAESGGDEDSSQMAQ